MDRRNFLTIGAPRTREAIRRESPGSARTDNSSQSQPVFARRSGTDLTPYSGQWTWREAAHLLRRSMFGPTEAEINQALSEGMNATIARLMTPFTPSVEGIEDWIDEPQFQAQPDADKGEDQQSFFVKLYERRGAFLRTILLSMKENPVSIQERLALFWHNHFTTEFDVVNYPELIYDQYHLIRQMILGNFKDFTYQISINMAMLLYLDGAKNQKIGNRDNINENYARELMELYTMGVYDWEGNENYSQNDVIEAARSLSGWTFDVDLANPRGLTYINRQSKYFSLLWDNGTKTFLGETGKWDTEDVIDIIFAQRADQIAKFICEKIYRAFVYDIADPVVVEQMASTFRSNNWEIKPVIEELLKSQHFYDVTNIGAMHRSPLDYMIGLFRQLEVTKIPGLDDTSNARANNDLGGKLVTLGQVPYSPPNVKGWPGGRTWISTSTLPVRQKIATEIAMEAVRVTGRPYYLFDPVAFARTFSDPYDIHILSQEMGRFLLNTEPSEQEAQFLYDNILDGGADYDWDLDNPSERPEERIRKFIAAAATLAKFQLT